MAVPDYLILGAGVAGLAAASRLVAAGRQVRILETRDRVGGRLHTLRGAWPTPIEGGAEFVHGDSPELQRLLDETGAGWKDLPEIHTQLKNGQASPLDFGAWEQILARIEQYQGPDLPFVTFLDQYCPQLSAQERARARDYVEGFHAADQETLSLEWLRRNESQLGAGDDSVRRLSTGYDQIVQALLRSAAGASLHLNTQALSVYWGPGVVSVAVSEHGHWNRTYEATRAIVTLPLGVLQAPAKQPGGIEFIPPLTAKQSCLELLAMGAVIKVVLWFREPPWRGISQSGFTHLPDQQFRTWWPLDDTGIVTGWSGGPRAKRLSARPDREILAQALSELAAGLGLTEERLRAALVDGRVFDWQKDPFSHGAYSYARAGGADAARELAQPLDETLYFAGEATATDLPATVGGAIQSGYRAAEEALR